MMTMTHWILLAVIAIVGAWDWWLATHPPEGDTISEVALSTARRHPLLPFVLGVIIGHLLWPQP
jgi:hypothetical protein